MTIGMMQSQHGRHACEDERHHSQQQQQQQQQQYPDMHSPASLSSRHRQQRQRRRRKMGVSLLTLTLVASTVSGFTSSTSSRSVASTPTLSSCCFVSAAVSPQDAVVPTGLPLKFPFFSPLLSSKVAHPLDMGGSGAAPANPAPMTGTRGGAGTTPKKSTPAGPAMTDRSSSLFSTWKRKTKNAVNRLFPSSSRGCNQASIEEQYERRKQEWAALYTNIDALREHFGANKNKLWGDLDATTSRRLYKTLLPRALIELYRLGVKPEDLAPLAYEARVTAKLYARERCQLPARLAAHGYDGFRQWRRCGKFQIRGMSYNQIWEKYKAAILAEIDDENDAEQDVTARICLKIIERSCQTNERIDRWVLGVEHIHTPDMAEQQRDLATITEQLERDVFEVLEGHRRDSSARRASTLRMLVRAKWRLERLQTPSVAATESLREDIRSKMQTDRPRRRMNRKHGNRKDNEKDATNTNDVNDLKDHHP